MPAFFKKAMPYIILINIICPILLLILYFSGEASVAGLHLYEWIILDTYLMVSRHDFSYCSIPGLITVLAAVLVNIFAFQSIKNDKVKAGIISSLLGGALCSFIAVKTANRDYRAKTAVYVIFNIFIWIFVWLIIPWLILGFPW